MLEVVISTLSKHNQDLLFYCELLLKYLNFFFTYYKLKKVFKMRLGISVIKFARLKRNLTLFISYP
jgi:hypothetical protein